MIEAKNSGMSDLYNSFLVWLGVAYQWSSQHEKSEILHSEFDKESRSRDPFLEIISHASRLHSTFSEKGPVEVDKALERCHEVSLRMNLSRNHIQIFCAKGALLAIEGRVPESLLFLEKARSAANLNSNNLDWLIFYRMASVVYINQNQIDDAEKMLNEAYIYLNKYNSPPWYAQELNRIKCIIKILRKPTVSNRIKNACRHFIFSLSFVSLHRLRKAAIVSCRFIFDYEVTFWNSSEIAFYLKEKLSNERDSEKGINKVEEIVMQFTGGALKKGQSSVFPDPVDVDLVSRLQTSFPWSECIVSDDQDDFLAQLDENYEGKLEIFSNDDDDILRGRLSQGKHFIGIRNESPLGGKIYAALVFEELTFAKSNIIEAGLKLIVGQYMTDLERFEHQKSMNEFAKSEAIAQTTQMLAHDVRKPFTMLKSMTSMLNNAHYSSVPNMIKQFTPEIDRALDDVNGLISDVMEVGNRSPVVRENTGLGALLGVSVNEAFRFRKNVRVNLNYELNHLHKISCNPLKVGRVFSNIISNALQAMNCEGVITFKSEEREGFIEVVIHNSGSYIEIENRSQLFDSFFTKGKKYGTGLGLTIAKKVIDDHGGRIWCTSDVSSGTSFHFLLPASSVEEVFDPESLPRKASDISSGYQNFNVDQMSINQGSEVIFKNAITSGKSVRVLICDDEPLYRSLVKGYLQELGNYVECLEVATGEEAVNAVTEFDPDVVIVDVDLGNASGIDGFEVTKKLRSNGSTAKICVHSNRGALEYNKIALTSGADVFLPKPMSKNHLFKFMFAAVGEPSQEKSSDSLIVVDDCPFSRSRWSNLDQFSNIRTYQSPEEFWEDVEQNPDVLDSAMGVVTDYYFDEHSSKTGLEFATDIRDKGYSGPVYLSSDVHLKGEELTGLSMSQISKDPDLAANEIRKYH